MGTKTAWSRQEAAILLEGYICVLKGDVSRLRVIRRISADLRKMAINNGVDIDDIFRNENGIYFQMQSMESAYFGRTVTKPATMLFTEIVSLYNEKRREYEELLKEARTMIEGNLSLKGAFSSWLIETNPTSHVETVLASCETIEQFCLKLKVLEAPLFETTDWNIIRSVHKTVSQNKVFRLVNRKQLKQIDTAMTCLLKYLREGNLEKCPVQTAPAQDMSAPTQPETHIDTEKPQKTARNAPDPYVRTDQDRRLIAKYPLIYKRIFSALYELYECEQVGTTIADLYERVNHIARCAYIEDILDNVSWSVCKNKQYAFSEEIVQHEEQAKPQELTANSVPLISEQEGCVIDFNDIDDLAYTKPVSFDYFSETVVGLSSWTGLYVAFFSILYPDYSHLLKSGMSFTRSGAGRVDLCEAGLNINMTDPKSIPGTSLYLETNISAKDIVGKIKFLLDLCQVDYENVIIKYQKNSTNVAALDLRTAQMGLLECLGKFDSKGFASFLRDQEGMATGTCRSYMSAINLAEFFAKTHHYEHNQLLTSDWREAKATVDALFSDPVFIKYNNQQHNRFRAAINKLLLFLCADNTTVVTTGSHAIAHPAPRLVSDDKYRDVLTRNFRKGFRLGSPIELSKFKRYFEQMNGKALDDDDASIERKIRTCGILFDDKVFVPQTMLGDETRDRLLAYIQKSFYEGKTALYYQALFKEFSEDFLDYFIYNADMLKAYLSFILSEEYFFGRNYLSKDENMTLDPIDEIRTCLQEYCAPMTYDMIFENLPHIPQQKIKQLLSYNGEFVSNGRGEYFHVSAAHLSDEEISSIADIIALAIEDKKFLSGNELVDAVKAKYPDTYEKNSAFSVVGLRDTIKYHLNNKFSFSGNIISSFGSSLTMSDVFAEYCRSRDSFTLDELNVLASELGTIIYFNSVYENSLRINHNSFVAKTRERFIVPDTDDAIDSFCTGDYTTINKISGYSLFPNAGFPWNEYLLEHYVAAYSNKYELLHIGFNANKCVGAIVKRSAGFKNFDDCIITVLAQSSITLKKQPALQYLRDEGYIARSIYNNIEELLIKATAQRNGREAN